jgi:hypothetical protein
MSPSTPHRASGSKQPPSTHVTHTPPSKQNILKQTVVSELADATWERDPVTRRALSSKTRKGGLHPLPVTIYKIDDFINCDVEIDTLDQLLSKAIKALKHEALPTDTSEKAHYRPLTFSFSTFARMRAVAFN